MWDLVKALEKEAGVYSSILQGLNSHPSVEEWPALTERYQHLQQQVVQQQQSVQPAELQQVLCQELKSCQVCAVAVCACLRKSAQCCLCQVGG